MITLKLRLNTSENDELLHEITRAYTGLFYKMYNNSKLMDDDKFIKSQLNRFIDKSIYDFCVTDVKTKIKQYDTNRKNKLKEIELIKKELSGEFKTKRELRHKYTLINRLHRLHRNIDKQITFGGKQLLRDITQLSQNNKKTPEQEKLLEKKKAEFTENRNIGVYLVGRACEKGNRKIDFDLTNNRIVFKVNKKDHIELTFKSRHNKEILARIQDMADKKLIPLTVRLTNTHVCISYDEELLSGYSFNDKACEYEKQFCLTKKDKDSVFNKFRLEQESRQKVGKLENRYLVFDLNPKYIGLCVFDDVNGKQKIIHRELINLSKLSSKLGLSSCNSIQVKQNNKRKHEIREVWKYIFNLARHYRVYYIGMEELDFTKSKTKDKGTEFNKQTKNLWHRELTNKLIKKYSHTRGHKIIIVKAAYSSFIGNMCHSYPDAVCAAIELGRRAMTQYTKGSSIYPDINEINQEKLVYLIGENADICGLNWKQLYSKIHLLRYRNPNDGYKDKYLASAKSKVTRYIC